jgi:asparagine synthase (glutamine-hydrolysing)
VSAIVAAAGSPLDPVTKRWVQDATAFSRYAGPDGDATHVAERFGLGHALLRTGPHEGEQPIGTEGQTWITADARLDGRPRGGEASHAGTILHAYETSGDAFLEQIAGDFAFALWDDRRQTLVCARDQFGIAPLHYARAGGTLLVASAIEALLLHPAISDELDERAIADFLVRDHPSDFAATTFAQIRRVPPGHVLMWRDGHAAIRRYWRQPEWEPLARFSRPEEYAERFRELLTAAVADRVTGDRVAIPLSGGMDSPSIAATARAVLRDRGAPNDALRAVTAVLGGDSGDREGDFAALVANHLGIEADVLDGSSFAPVDPFAEPVVRTPEPAWYRRTAFEYEIARVPSMHAPVALSGLGGDPLLWFTPWYWAEWLARGRAVRLARAWRQRASLFGGRPHPHVGATLAHARERLTSRRFPVPAWLAPDLAARTNAADRTSPDRGPRGRELDARTLGGDPFWPTLLWWADPCYTGLPMRFRHPFFDLRLVRFTASLPPEPWLMSKRILREAMRGALPEEIRTRRKTLLVEAPMPGLEPEVMARLGELVRTAPGLGRFVDVDALAAAVTDPGAATTPRSEFELRRPLGLAHWLTHWRAPDPVR